MLFDSSSRYFWFWLKEQSQTSQGSQAFDEAREPGAQEQEKEVGGSTTGRREIEDIWSATFSGRGQKRDQRENSRTLEQTKHSNGRKENKKGEKMI